MKLTLSLLCLVATNFLLLIPPTVMATNTALRSNYHNNEEVNEEVSIVIAAAPPHHEVMTIQQSANDNNNGHQEQSIMDEDDDNEEHQQQEQPQEIIFVTSQMIDNMTSVTTTRTTTMTTSRKMSSDIEQIQGGTWAIVDQFPYFVDWFGCGGSLIAPDIVLTAAHCGGTLGDVIVGGVIPGSTNRGGIRRKVIRAVKHEKYNEQKFHLDFLLLKLDQPIWSKERVDINLNRKKPSTGMKKPMTVIGMGDLNEDGTASDRLREVNLRYISNKECKDTLTRLYDDDDVTWAHLCALYPPGGKDSCSGDSGGPMIIKRDKQVDVQVGIVSWGYGCARPGVPGVYSRVASAQEWIIEKTCALTAVKRDSLRPEFCQTASKVVAVAQQQSSSSSEPFVDDSSSVPQVDVSSEPSSCGIVRLQFEADWRGKKDNEFILEDLVTGDYIWEESKFEKFQIIHRSACIDRDGCHRFNFQDKKGDGLRGRGMLTLLYEGKKVYEENKNIGSGMIVYFGDGCESYQQ